jgi:hypothetical protein
MRSKLRWAVTAVAAAAAGAAIGMTAVPGPARAAPGWRIERVFGGSDVLDVQGIAASGADNAWLLGVVPVPGGPDFVIQRWNGSRWVPVALPARLPGGGPWALDAGIYTTSPGDTWFFPALSVHDANQAIIVMHWNGTAWSAPRLPALPPVKRGYPWVAAAITAAGPGDAWVAETPAANQAGYSPGGLILLHWNGSAWRTVAENRTLGDVTGLTPDGHGGFWLTTTDPANPGAGDIADYRNGTFTSQPAPARPGYTGSAAGIVAVPGTGSFWATGTLTAVKGGTTQTDILRYTP